MLLERQVLLKCALASSPGHHYYTVGQKACIGGQPHAWFVARKDPLANTVTVVSQAW